MAEKFFGAGIPLASGFDLGAKKPLDSRLVVNTIAERDEHVTGNRAYVGLIVYVIEEAKNYQYNGTEWLEFGVAEEVDLSDYLTLEEVEALLEDKADKSDVEALQTAIGENGLGKDITDLKEADTTLQGNIDTLAQTVEANKTAQDTINEDVAGQLSDIKDTLTSQFKAEVVDELPEVGELNIIYLVPDANDDEDLYNEYLYINGAFELIGDTHIDLTPYAKVEDVEADIKAVQDVVDANVEDITANANAIAKLQEDLGLLDTEVDGKANQTDLEALQGVVGNAEAGLVKDVADLQGAVEGLEGVVGDAEAGLVKDVADLQAKDTVLETAIGNKLDSSVYSNKVIEIEEDILANANAIEELKGALGLGGGEGEEVSADAITRIGLLEGKMSIAEGDIDNLQTQAHTHANAEELDKIVVGDVAKWNALKNYDDTKVKEDITANANAIALLKAQVEGNDADIEALQSGKADAVHTHSIDDITDLVAMDESEASIMWAQAKIKDGE